MRGSPGLDRRAVMCHRKFMIYVGTSGFSYDDWRGHFYPADLPKNQFLTYYAQRLNALEVNFTYYRMPTARTMAGLADKSEGRVNFVVKLHGAMTHERTAAPEDYRAFLEACAPLCEQNHLGALLAQFPFSFHCNEANRDYLKNLRERLGESDVVVEMRNARWLKQETFELLKDLRFGWCNVDEPQLKGLLPPTAVATSDIGYVRFHGRNAQKWFQHKHAYERYNYLYTQDELAEWTPKIKMLENLTKRTYAFTNNHFEAKAVTNALMLLDLLR